MNDNSEKFEVGDKVRFALRNGKIEEGVVRAVISTTKGPELNISFGPKAESGRDCERSASDSKTTCGQLGIKMMTLSDELDKFETIVTGLACMAIYVDTNLPPERKPFYPKTPSCPHCRALLLIGRIRKELEEHGGKLSDQI